MSLVNGAVGSGRNRWEVRLAGTGGQGLITAGIILAEAAALFDDRHVVQTQTYGPESRGGASRADVIIGTEPIDYPEVSRPGVLLVLSQQAMDRYGRQVTAGGLVLFDSDLVEPVVAEAARPLGLPFTETARSLGRVIVANVVALAALVAVTGCVSQRALEQAVLGRVPERFAELNRRALAAGWNLVRSQPGAALQSGKGAGA